MFSTIKFILSLIQSHWKVFVPGKENIKLRAKTKSKKILKLRLMKMIFLSKVVLCLQMAIFYM